MCYYNFLVDTSMTDFSTYTITLDSNPNSGIYEGPKDSDSKVINPFEWLRFFTTIIQEPLELQGWTIFIHGIKQLIPKVEIR